MAIVNDSLVKLKSFGLQCNRVWHVLRKPTMKEFKMTAKVTAIGGILLGLLGFLISIVVKFAWAF